MKYKQAWSEKIGRNIVLHVFAFFLVAAVFMIPGCQDVKPLGNTGRLNISVLAQSPFIPGKTGRPGGDEVPVAGAEVWVWEKDKFKGTPDYTKVTDSRGVASFDLPAGVRFSISLPPRNACTTLEEASQACGGGYLTLDPGEQFELVLAGPTKAREPVETPDKQAFKTFFSNMALDQSPPQGKYCYTYPPDVLVTGGGQHCLFGIAAKDVSISNALYDIIGKKYFQPPKKYPPMISPGYFQICEPFYPPPGYYEYRVYAQDKLVAVFPFDVVIYSTPPKN